MKGGSGRSGSSSSSSTITDHRTTGTAQDEEREHVM